ncbi:DUF421 domain-containing protein [Sphingobium sp. JS3065]|uniref:DUF421 domain-containing protein n=1 Tax=Sphingobium sp. JS3065 TaxID=2970925 RepID=UPI002263D504|nr:YetF domain-containing protein [Sphingobium sp. JS3065]UZW57022.1 DUF421 domain-containing protein [Sphingobium sp. JS3065]
MELLYSIVGPNDGTPSALQLCARAFLLFFYGILCIRIAGRRAFAHLSPLDIIVAIVVGSNISRAMMGNAPFVGALAATLLLVILYRLFAWMTVRHHGLGHMLKGDATVLIRDGRVDEEALKRNHLSQADLMEGLRMEQHASVDDVACATLERGGKISVVPKSK